MSVIITNGKFEGTERKFVEIANDANFSELEDSIAVSSDLDPASLIPFVHQLNAICIEFPTSADGRGNSIAKALRQAGFKGLLRARGHILADQYPLAIRNGFDDVEISDELAERQPESQWLDAYQRINSNYQNRLKTKKVVKRAAA